jgi:hypothetical protein
MGARQSRNAKWCEGSVEMAACSAVGVGHADVVEICSPGRNEIEDRRRDLLGSIVQVRWQILDHDLVCTLYLGQHGPDLACQRTTRDNERSRLGRLHGHGLFRTPRNGPGSVANVEVERRAAAARSSKCAEPVSDAVAQVEGRMAAARTGLPLRIAERRSS